MNQATLFADAEPLATFSPCERYRYTLVRLLTPKGLSRRVCVFCCLNPSTATAELDDPSVRRMIGYARAWGFDALIVVNAFAWRSTAPSALYIVEDPVGPANDNAILEAAKRAELVVCGWGTHGALRERGTNALRMLRENGIVPMCLGVNADGSCKHPLYLRRDAELCSYEVTRGER